MAEGIRRETLASLSNEVILVDRAVIDALGYLNAALHVTQRPSQERRRTILEDMARAYCRDYDLLVVTVLDTTVPLGSGRDQDEVFRRTADQEILKLAHSLRRPFITMTTVNRQSVKKKIIDFVHEQRSQHHRKA
jgi:hypothetical protein